VHGYLGAGMEVNRTEVTKSASISNTLPAKKKPSPSEAAIPFWNADFPLFPTNFTELF
jgi:hypothetical protein